MWSTQYYFLLSGNGLIAPLCVQVYADTSTALRCDSATDAPLSMFTTKVAVNESPAPTVSATSTLGVSMDEISPLTSYMPLRTAPCVNITYLSEKRAMSSAIASTNQSKEKGERSIMAIRLHSI